LSPLGKAKSDSSYPWLQKMFEDFKEKVGKLQNKLDSEIPSMSNALAPEIIEKLNKAGIDPDNVAIQQLFPPTYDGDGNDISLMSSSEGYLLQLNYRQALFTEGEERLLMHERSGSSDFRQIVHIKCKYSI
jgi:AAA15 family ATPase/GTPase